MPVFTDAAPDPSVVVPLRPFHIALKDALLTLGLAVLLNLPLPLLLHLGSTRFALGSLLLPAVLLLNAHLLHLLAA